MSEILDKSDYLTMAMANVLSDEKIKAVLQNNGAANWTICPECRLDDFTHVDRCSIRGALEKSILESITDNTIDSVSNIFSFRAECEADANKFCEECIKAGVQFSMNVIRDPQFNGLPDVEVEAFANVPLASLRNVLRMIDDSHVMLQTLRPCSLAFNSLERDHSL